MEKVDRIIGAVSRYFDYLARIGVIATMALVTINVILRYLWVSIPGTYDLVQVMTALFIGAGIAYTAYERGNVEIEILMERFPPRVQSAMASAMMFIAAVFMGIATWQMIVFGHRSSVAGDTTMTVYLPFAPFLYWIAFGLGLMVLIMLLQSIRLARKAVKP